MMKMRPPNLVKLQFCLLFFVQGGQLLKASYHYQPTLSLTKKLAIIYICSSIVLLGIFWLAAVFSTVINFICVYCYWHCLLSFYVAYKFGLPSEPKKQDSSLFILCVCCCLLLAVLNADSFSWTFVKQDGNIIPRVNRNEIYGTLSLTLWPKL